MRRVWLAVLIVLALASVGRGPARGQTSSGSLVGSWLVALTLPGASSPLSVLLTCHADGTATAMLPGFGDSAGAGAWAQNEDGTFGLTTLHIDQNPPPSNTLGVDGFLKLRYSVSLSGGTLTGTAEAINTDLMGNVVKDITGVTLTATPIGVEQIGS